MRFCIFIVFFIVFLFCSCDYSGSNYQNSEPEYSGKEGELGGKCILPFRTCNCYPQCYCDGSDFTCRLMPDRDIFPDSDELTSDDDTIIGPPDGWGGQENIPEG